MPISVTESGIVNVPFNPVQSLNPSFAIFTTVRMVPSTDNVLGIIKLPVIAVFSAAIEHVVADNAVPTNDVYIGNCVVGACVVGACVVGACVVGACVVGAVDGTVVCTVVCPVVGAVVNTNRENVVGAVVAAVVGAGVGDGVGAGVGAGVGMGFKRIKIAPGLPGEIRPGFIGWPIKAGACANFAIIALSPFVVN